MKMTLDSDSGLWIRTLDADSGLDLASGTLRIRTAPSAPFLNTQTAKTPWPPRHQSRDTGFVMEPRRTLRHRRLSKRFLNKTAPLDPPNNAPSGPKAPLWPQAPKAGAERPAAASSLPFGFASWGSKSKI